MAGDHGQDPVQTVVNDQVEAGMISAKGPEEDALADRRRLCNTGLQEDILVDKMSVFINYRHFTGYILWAVLCAVSVSRAQNIFAQGASLVASEDNHTVSHCSSSVSTIWVRISSLSLWSFVHPSYFSSRSLRFSREKLQTVPRISWNLLSDVCLPSRPQLSGTHFPPRWDMHHGCQHK